MRQAAVINMSRKYYNLGAQKLTNWLRAEGWTVREFDGDPGLFLNGCDLICLSVIFSWDAPDALNIALLWKDRAEVWAGGPGLFALCNWWKEHAGFDCHKGLDQRFENQEGKYRYTFASRGCPVNCWFCIVPRLEGKTFTLNWDFSLASILCDNNLSALPMGFQCHIVRRYSEPGAPPLLDCNSGFEPKSFDWQTYAVWKYVLRGPWRFAYDYLPEKRDVARMMKILHAEPRKKKRVYVLIGNEPMEACYERAIQVVEWGGEPFCQPVLPLNALSKDAFTIRYDWTKQRLIDFARYFNRFLWKYAPLTEYRSRQHEPAPFAGSQFTRCYA
ncbi:MAG TPA: hypothetical protein VKW06_00315 [Candidatus Angelobacter sp.]|nr:hypothetical protein [Candidatus Angelobacter sp.]